MKKNLLTLVLIFSLGFVVEARADFEGIQTVFTVIEGVTKKIDNVYGKVQSVVEKVKAIRAGQIGPINLNKIKGYVEQGKELLTGGSLKEKVTARFKFGNILKGVEGNNTRDIEQGIIEETVPLYTDEAQAETYIKFKEINDKILQENIARLYAYAFTLRTNLSKERKENDDTPLATTDSREIYGLANKEALESARRLNRILDMQASKDEINIQLMIRTESRRQDEEE